MLHELAHLVHSMFFMNKNQFLGEGFADTVVFYILDYEEIFPEYKSMLENLKEEQILSANELINLGKQHKFHPTPLIPNSTCSFEITYISSYLLVRGIIQKIEEKYNVDKFMAMQKFLEIMRTIKCYEAWLVFEIAEILGLSKETLLYGKEMQMAVLSEIIELSNQKRNGIIK